MTRYRSGGLEALADRSKRPKSSPWQMSGEVEALVCQLVGSFPGRDRAGCGRSQAAQDGSAFDLSVGKVRGALIRVVREKP